jgi:hypothetical protein
MRTLLPPVRPDLLGHFREFVFLDLAGCGHGIIPDKMHIPGNFVPADFASAKIGHITGLKICPVL